MKKISLNIILIWGCKNLIFYYNKEKGRFFIFSERVINMLVFAFIILSHVFLLWFIKKTQNGLKYSTACCRDVRASMGMWVYPSQVEYARQRINRPDSKF